MATKVYGQKNGAKQSDPVMIAHDCAYTATRSGTTVTVVVEIWSAIRDSTSCYIGSSGGAQTINASITYGGVTKSGSKVIKATSSEYWHNTTAYGSGPPPYMERNAGSWHATSNGVKYSKITLTVTGVPAATHSLTLATSNTSSTAGACGTFSSSNSIAIPTADAPTGVTCSVSGGGARSSTYTVTSGYSSIGTNGGSVSTRGYQISTNGSSWTTFATTTDTKATVTPSAYGVGYGATFYLRTYITNTAGLTTYSSAVAETTAVQPASPVITISPSPVKDSSTNVTISATSTGASTIALKIGSTSIGNSPQTEVLSTYGIDAGGSYTVSATGYNAYSEAGSTATKTGYVAALPNAATGLAVDNAEPNLTQAVTFTWNEATIPANSGTVSSYTYRYRTRKAGVWGSYTTVASSTTRSVSLVVADLGITVNDAVAFSVQTVSSLGNVSSYTSEVTATITGAMASHKIGGVYKKGLVFYKVNGVWKLAANIFTKVSGAWKQGL